MKTPPTEVRLDSLSSLANYLPTLCFRNVLTKVLLLVTGVQDISGIHLKSSVNSSILLLNLPVLEALDDIPSRITCI
jgi:hypothetical protein